MILLIILVRKRKGKMRRKVKTKAQYILKVMIKKEITKKEMRKKEMKKKEMRKKAMKKMERIMKKIVNTIKKIKLNQM